MLFQEKQEERELTPPMQRQTKIITVKRHKVAEAQEDIDESSS